MHLRLVVGSNKCNGEFLAQLTGSRCPSNPPTALIPVPQELMSQEPLLVAGKEPTGPVSEPTLESQGCGIDPFIPCAVECMPQPRTVHGLGGEKGWILSAGCPGREGHQRLSLRFPWFLVCPQGLSKGSAPANPCSCSQHPTMSCSIGETKEKKQRDSAKMQSPLLSCQKPRGDHIIHFPKCFSFLKGEGQQGFKLPEGHGTELHALTPRLCPALWQRMCRELQCFHSNRRMLLSRVPAVGSCSPQGLPAPAELGP